MTSASAPPCAPLLPPPPHIAAAIVRAERRREVLERLSNLGMDLAQDIAARAAQAPRAPDPGQTAARTPAEPPPEPRHEPGRAFAAVSRAVRFTLALEAKIDEEILALLRGEAPGAAPKFPAAAAEAPAWTPKPPPNALERQRGKVAACVWDAVEEGMTDPEAADDLCAVVQERLMESEAYDEFLFRPFRESVAAICQDLGLKPDWRRWDDELGFPPETRRTDHNFTSDWATWPSGAQARRMWYAATPRPIEGPDRAQAGSGLARSPP
jgi:hypothetical protein